MIKIFISILCLSSALLSDFTPDIMPWYQPADEEGATMENNGSIKIAGKKKGPNDKNVTIGVKDKPVIEIPPTMSQQRYNRYIKRGKTLYSDFLHESCKKTPKEFMDTHTREEWKELQGEGGFKDEILNICPDTERQIREMSDPKLKLKLKGKWSLPLFLYLLEHSTKKK